MHSQRIQVPHPSFQMGAWCGDFNAVAFSGCTVGVTPGAWNRWELHYNVERADSLEKQIADLEHIFDVWFTAAGIRVTDLRVQSETQPEWGPPVDSALRCSVPITMRGSYRSFFAEFVVRTPAAARITWPVYRSAPPGIRPPGFDTLTDWQCPVGADCALVDAYAPSDLPVPKDEDFWDKAAGLAGHYSGEFAGSIIMISAASLAGLYLLWRVLR